MNGMCEIEKSKGVILSFLYYIAGWEGIEVAGLQGIVGFLERSEIDTALLNLAGYDVEGVLGQNDKIVTDLVEFFNERSELLL